VTAQLAAASAGVTGPEIAFQPATVDVRPGGTVTWTFVSIPHNVVFTTPGAPADAPELQEESAFRTFANHGTFNYHCTIHPTMNGVVNVH
jgi:plastocyanin